MAFVHNRQDIQIVDVKILLDAVHKKLQRVESFAPFLRLDTVLKILVIDLGFRVGKDIGNVGLIALIQGAFIACIAGDAYNDAEKKDKDQASQRDASSQRLLTDFRASCFLHNFLRLFEYFHFADKCFSNMFPKL